VLPESIFLPSGEKVTAVMAAVWPVKVIDGRPVVKFHKIIVLSQLPESTELPSGEKATEVTRSVCPL
jgi:hypothetical protein